MDIFVALGVNQNQSGLSAVRWVRPAQRDTLVPTSPAFGTLSLAIILMVFMWIESILTGAELQSMVDTLGLRSETWSWTDVFGYGHILTYALLHANARHFAWNVILLLLVGSVLEWRIGWRMVGLLCVVGAVAAGMSHLFMFPDEPRPLIGASGVVSTLFGTAVVVLGSLGVRIRLPLSDYWFSLTLRRLLLAWVAIQGVGVALVYASPGMPLSVAYWAHLAGFATGVAGGVIYVRCAGNSHASVAVPAFAAAGN